MEQMLKPKQVGELLEVSLPTVRRLYRSGELEYRKLGYRTVRILRSSVEAFLERHKPGPIRDVPDHVPFELPHGANR